MGITSLPNLIQVVYSTFCSEVSILDLYFFILAWVHLSAPLMTRTVPIILVSLTIPAFLCYLLEHQKPMVLSDGCLQSLCDQLPFPGFPQNCTDTVKFVDFSVLLASEALHHSNLYTVIELILRNVPWSTTQALWQHHSFRCFSEGLVPT